MSFILDALKKLEQKRQRSSVPDLMTVHVPVPQDIKKRPVWPYLILGALILNASLLVIWLRPWEPSSPSHSIKRAADTEHSETDKRALPQDIDTTQKSEIKHTPEASQRKDVPAKFTGKRSPPEKPATQPQVVISEKPVKTSRDIQLPGNSPDRSLSTEQTTKRSSINEPKLPDIDQNISENRIPELIQLPQNTQSEIPQLKIHGHIYSNNPDTRLININGDIYKEGDTVTKNLKIEEITEKGAILNYSGTRFQLRAF